MAVALFLEQRDACSGCGHPLSVTTTSEAQGGYTLSDAVCAGCVAAEVGSRPVEGERPIPGRKRFVIRRQRR